MGQTVDDLNIVAAVYHYYTNWQVEHQGAQLLYRGARLGHLTRGKLGNGAYRGTRRCWAQWRDIFELPNWNEQALALAAIDFEVGLRWGKKLRHRACGFRFAQNEIPSVAE